MMTGGGGCCCCLSLFLLTFWIMFVGWDLPKFLASMHRPTLFVVKWMKNTKSREEEKVKFGTKNAFSKSSALHCETRDKLSPVTCRWRNRPSPRKLWWRSQSHYYFFPFPLPSPPSPLPMFSIFDWHWLTLGARVTLFNIFWRCFFLFLITQTRHSLTHFVVSLSLSLSLTYSVWHEYSCSSFFPFYFLLLLFTSPTSTARTLTLTYSQNVLLQV